MPTIAEQLAQLAQIKANIKDAIEAKGETVGSDAFATYPTHIGNISGGGGDDVLVAILTDNMTELVIPDSVTSIRNYACNSMTKLTSVTMSDNVTSIGIYAFATCSRMVSIRLSKNLSAIPQSLVSGCQSLTSIDIPSGVTTMGQSALYQCKAMTTIICRATTPPTTNNQTFGNGANTYTGRNTYNQGVNKLYVPQGCSSAYNTSYWASTLLNSTKCGFTIAELDANGNIPT